MAINCTKADLRLKTISIKYLKRLLWVLPLLSVVCLPGCEPTQVDIPDPKLEIAEYLAGDALESLTLQFDASASSKTFAVRSNRAWIAVLNGTDWCKVSPDKGDSDHTLTVTVSQNEGAIRKAEILISTILFKRTIYVEQQGVGEESPEKPEIPDDPQKPDNPQQPEDPEIPDDPEVPDLPDDPGQPGQPDDPETPENPNDPDDSDNPEIPAVNSVIYFADDFVLVENNRVYTSDKWVFTSTDSAWPTNAYMGWFGKSNESEQYINIAPYTSLLTEIVAYAVMPQFNVAEAPSKMLTFDLAWHFKTKDNSKFEVVASKNYAGNVSTATWELVASYTYTDDKINPTNIWTSYSIDLSAKYAQERALTVAFRYIGKSNTYRLDNVEFGAVESSDEDEN